MPGGRESDLKDRDLYEDRAVAELRVRAKELGLSGYSGRKKAELLAMLRDH